MTKRSEGFGWCLLECDSERPTLEYELLNCSEPMEIPHVGSADLKEKLVFFQVIYETTVKSEHDQGFHVLL